MKKKDQIDERIDRQLMTIKINNFRNILQYCMIMSKY